MSRKTPKSYRVIGALAIILGLMSFIPLINFDESKLLVPESDNFVVKYSMLISFISGGIFFIVMGILQFFGFLTPYYMIGDDELEKAKVYVVGSVLISPALIALSATLFKMSDNSKFKLAWSVMLIYFAWLFVNGINTVKKHLTKKR